MEEKDMYQVLGLELPETGGAPEEPKGRAGESPAVQTGEPKELDAGLLRRVLEERTAEVAAIDPEIKSIADIMDLETADKFREYVLEKNLSIADAFKLANMGRLTENAREQSRRQAMKLVSSKEHLRPTATRGKGALSVPAEELALYRELLPGVSDAEIQRHYNEYRKSR